MKRNITINAAVAALLMAVATSAHALEVTLHQAGTLSQFITDKYAVNDLTVIGPINGTDIKLIRDMAGCNENGQTTSGIMTTLDLSGAQIEAGGEPYYRSYTTEDDALGIYMFAGTKLVKATLPLRVTSIAPGLFARCYNLVEISVPEQSGALESVDGVLFVKFTSGVYLWEYPSGKTASTYTVPSFVTKLGTVNTVAYAFMYNDYLRSVELPSTITQLDGCFYKSSIEEITIPASVTAIGSMTFQGCTSMTKVTSMIAQPFPIDDQTFADGAAARTLFVPQGTKTAYQSTTGWNVFTDIQEMAGEGSLDPIAPLAIVPEAGKLSEVLAGINTNNVEELSIVGPINGTDIRLIRSMGGCDYLGKPTNSKLRKLDLSNATIVAGGYRYLEATTIETKDTQLRGNYYNSIDEANTIGDYMFAGMTVSEILLPQNITTIGAAPFALCENLRGIALPSSLRSVYNHVFTYSNLIAIDWPLNGEIQDFVTFANLNNPNTIFYVKKEEYAPAGFQNIVVNGTADRIVLNDGYDFYNLKDFYATNISYRHHYTKTSGMGQASGWETIALPFMPREITHETKGELMPFLNWTERSQAKPFWLYEMVNGIFSPASGIEPNKPYIICMPNNDSYKEEYRLGGNVTFEASNATVKATQPIVSQWGDKRTFAPAFSAKAPATNIYAMNAEGSMFAASTAVQSFSAYITTDGSYTRPTISIFGDDEQPMGIAEMAIMRKADNDKIYNLAGQKVNKPTKAGIYIVGGKKIVVK